MKRCSNCLRVTDDTKACYVREETFSYAPVAWSKEPRDLCARCREYLRGHWKYAKEASQ
jgi:hypothetical protein